ncbi:MAG: hypothetical protein AB7F19_02565 [Candidatus Babeliales bacterium]
MKRYFLISSCLTLMPNFCFAMEQKPLIELTSMHQQAYPAQRDLLWDFAKIGHLMRTAPKDLCITGASKEGKTEASKAKLQQAFLSILGSVHVTAQNDDTRVKLDLTQLDAFCTLVQQLRKDAKAEQHACLDEQLATLEQTPPEKIFIRGLPYQKRELQIDIASRLCTLPKAIAIDKNGVVTLEGPLIDAFVYNAEGLILQDKRRALTKTEQIIDNFEALDKVLDGMPMPEWPLVEACQPHYHEAYMLFYLSKGCSVTTWGPDGLTPPLIALAHAAELQPSQRAKAKFIALLKAGADPNRKIHDQGSPLHFLKKADTDSRKKKYPNSIRIGIELLEAAIDPAKRNNMPLNEYLECMEKRDDPIDENPEQKSTEPQIAELMKIRTATKKYCEEVEKHVKSAAESPDRWKQRVPTLYEQQLQRLLTEIRKLDDQLNKIDPTGVRNTIEFINRWGAFIESNEK